MNDVFEFATRTLEPLLSFNLIFCDNGVPNSPGVTSSGVVWEPFEFNVVTYVYMALVLAGKKCVVETFS